MGDDANEVRAALLKLLGIKPPGEEPEAKQQELLQENREQPPPRSDDEDSNDGSTEDGDSSETEDENDQFYSSEGEEDKGGNSGGKWERLWNDNWRALRKFQQQTGHCNVPKSAGRLGEWVLTQRKFYKKGILSQDRIEKLNSLGFEWRKSNERTWKEHVDELKRFREQTGSCNVPQSAGRLGKWVQTQRQLFHKEQLPSDRQGQLDQLGFEWNKYTTYQGLWNQQYSELRDFQKQHGHCSVPKGSGKLGNWIQTQRKLYKKGKLSEKRIEKLTAIGFEWGKITNQTEDPWFELYAALKRFKNEHGHCNPPKGSELSDWVQLQRQNFKSGVLSEEKEEKLSRLGLDWEKSNSWDSLWNERYFELKEFQEKHGHCNVPKSIGAVGEWVLTQRKSFKKGLLSKDRIARLNQLGFEWDRKNRDKGLFKTSSQTQEPPTNKPLTSTMDGDTQSSADGDNIDQSIDPALSFPSLPPPPLSRPVRKSKVKTQGDVEPSREDQLAADTDSNPAKRRRLPPKNLSEFLS